MPAVFRHDRRHKAGGSLDLYHDPVRAGKNPLSRRLK